MSFQLPRKSVEVSEFNVFCSIFYLERTIIWKLVFFLLVFCVKSRHFGKIGTIKFQPVEDVCKVYSRCFLLRSYCCLAELIKQPKGCYGRLDEHTRFLDSTWSTRRHNRNNQWLWFSWFHLNRYFHLVFFFLRQWLQKNFDATIRFCS